jgi:hypothetical protein
MMRRIRFVLIHLFRGYVPPLCFAMLLWCSVPAAHGQGCSMCRDTTAGSAPQIRAALRRAITVLAIPAIALFIGFFAIARRTNTWTRIEESHRTDDER